MKKAIYSLIGGAILAGTCGLAMAGEPQTLSTAQMDSVTAGNGNGGKDCCGNIFVGNSQRVVNAGRINSGGGDDVNAVALNIINASAIYGDVTALAVAVSD